MLLVLRRYNYSFMKKLLTSREGFTMVFCELLEVWFLYSIVLEYLMEENCFGRDPYIAMFSSEFVKNSLYELQKGDQKER